MGGLYERRNELPSPINDFSKGRLDPLAQDLLDSGEICRCAATGSKHVKWLDVPGGPFARGEGEFSTGAYRGRR